MARISNLSADDSRSVWKKISRRQYWNGLKALNISCPVGATQSQMIVLSQAAGVTPDQVTKFIPVRVAADDGGSKVVMLPENHEREYDERKETRRMMEFERRLEEGVEKDSAAKLKMETEKNVEIQGLKTELEDLKAMMQKLLQQGTEQNTESRSKPLTAETELGPALPRPQDNPLKMHWKSFQKLAKQSGIEWSPKDPREPVIMKLEVQDGENAA